MGMRGAHMLWILIMVDVFGTATMMWSTVNLSSSNSKMVVWRPTRPRRARRCSVLPCLAAAVAVVTVVLADIAAVAVIAVGTIK